MYYQDISPIPKKEAEIILEHGDIEAIQETLVRLAFHEPDWKWVETYCLRFLEYPESSVQAVAATCLGHLARIHRAIDTELVMPALYALLSKSEVAGPVNDAIDDIKLFTGHEIDL